MSVAPMIAETGADWLDLRIDAPLWSEALDVEALVRRAAEAALETAGVAPTQVEISFLLTDDAAISELNGAFRDKPKPTNVLSWPSVALDRPALPEDLTPTPFFLGDVALAFETTREESVNAGKPLEEHAAHLIVHGVLHLLGYDHQDEGEAALMEARETAALRRVGYASPYEGRS